MKSYAKWLGLMMWCRTNPEKLAGIVTFEGLYEVTFKPHRKDLLGIVYVEYDEGTSNESNRTI